MKFSTTPPSVAQKTTLSALKNSSTATFDTRLSKFTRLNCNAPTLPIFLLEQALKKAGVKTLIVSLWDVNDTVTQKIMVSFYKYYSEGYNWRKSFEFALDDIRRNREYKAPKYWAPFVMID